MIERKTLFVLGAGASKPYNYPTGRELKTYIVRSFPADFRTILNQTPKTYASNEARRSLLPDAEVLSKVAEVCDGMNLLIGPVLKENYEVVGKAILDHGHTAIAQSPLDINLLKELNVKLSKFFPPDRIVIDPMSSALGYGVEYSFSLMERVKQIGVIGPGVITAR